MRFEYKKNNIRVYNNTRKKRIHFSKKTLFENSYGKKEEEKRYLEEAKLRGGKRNLNKYKNAIYQYI